MNAAPVTTAQGAFAHALLDAAQKVPDGVRASRGANLERRFAVYRQNFARSLIDGLAGTFPVVQALVGDAFFNALADGFVRTHPPRQAALALYGAGFATFIDAYLPARSVPYLSDVGRLEFARSACLHAADRAPADASDLASAAQRLLDGQPAGIGLHPSVGIVRSAHPIVSLWAAHQDALDQIEQIDLSSAQDALVVRQGFSPRVLLLPPAMGPLVGMLKDRADLCEVLRFSDITETDLFDGLALLARHGALAVAQPLCGDPP